MSTPNRAALDAVIEARDLTKLVMMGAESIYETAGDESNAMQKACRIIIDRLDDATEALIRGAPAAGEG